MSAHEHDFRAVTFGLLVHAVHDNEIVCHGEQAYSAKVHWTDETVPDHNIAGCSGGPVFFVGSTPGVTPQLCAIVSEAAAAFGDNILFRLARLDQLATARLRSFG